MWQTKLTDYTSRLIGRYLKQKNAIPIIVYHDIGNRATGNVISQIQFMHQMRILYESGYRAIELRELKNDKIRFSNNNKLIVITFDDFYASHIEYCVPALMQFGFKGSFFIPTAIIKEERTVIKNLFGREERKIGNWEDVLKLKQFGMEIGSHSHNHLKLGGLSLAQAVNEIEKSKDILESRCQEKIVSFAYPYGRRKSYNGAIKNQLRAVGFRFACTTYYGRFSRHTDPFEIPRIPIESYDDAQTFQHKIRGHYDFLKWKRW